MNERIKELAISNGIYDCITDPYDKVGDGNPHSSVMIDLERFAELIVRECVDIADEYDGAGSTIVSRIEKHFGVEE